MASQTGRRQAAVTQHAGAAIEDAPSSSPHEDPEPSAIEHIADLARRQLVVVERYGQAQIIRFCVNVTPRVKPESLNAS